ncbi:heavy metal translocating P-type ATPase, partial [Dyadobacter psychrotolerans]
MENHHGHHHMPKEVPMPEDHHPTKQMDEHQGHDKHAGHHTEDFLKRFWICMVLTIPVLLLSHMIQQMAGFDLTFAGDKYVLLILSSIIY